MADETTEAIEAPAAKPMLQIVNPDATPEQIAAIVAVFASLGGSAPAPKKARSLWATPQPRLTYASGLGGWRASGLPR